MGKIIIKEVSIGAISPEDSNGQSTEYQISIRLTIVILISSQDITPSDRPVKLRRG
jgi:hypothetical protein